MGNKLCKKKSDAVDNANYKSPSQFDRIINRLHIRPNSWKSDPQLNQKQVKRIEKHPNEKPNNVITSKSLSKSSDWTEVDLEVPDKDEHVHLANPKLNLIFNNNEKGTPTPPPRKHKKNFREKIEAVAKTGLQAFQSKSKPVEDNQPKKPVVEEVFVKKTINYRCPICEQDEATHNRDHHHHHDHPHLDHNKDVHKTDKIDNFKNEKENLKRKKTLSVTSLPNYDELKFTVAEFDEPDKGLSSTKQSRKSVPSEISLPIDPKKSVTGSTGKLDTYITRCRSFGSLFPQQFKKLRPRKIPADIESDDSFGGLEDWDLGLIEHYNPKDASLPRPRKVQKSDDDSILAGIESLIVKEEDIEQPKPPVRRSESLAKKQNKEAVLAAQRNSNDHYQEPRIISEHIISPPKMEENRDCEHSTLIKILEKFSMEDKQKHNNENNITKTVNSNESSLTPSLVEFEKNIPINSIEDIITAEKINKGNEVKVNDINVNTVKT